MIGFALDAVTSFSTLPLRMTTYLGLMAGATGLATLSWVLVSYLLGNVMTGWTSIAGLVLILGSVQLIVLGVIDRKSVVQGKSVAVSLDLGGRRNIKKTKIAKKNHIA